MAKTIRMADIAEKLGVSVVTVSKALRGKDGVGEELRTQIFKAAEELGYTIKSVSTDNYVIGILTAGRFLERGSSFYWGLYERLLTHLSTNGDFGFLEVVNTEDEADCSVPRIVQEKRADGLIIMGQFDESYIKMIGRQGIPFTMLDAYTIRSPYDTVISDGYYGMCTMTDYLIQQGHKDIMFIGTVGATGSISDRYFGYCRALTEAGLPIRPDMVIPDRGLDGRVNVALPPDIAQRATAIVCNCDFTAYDVFTKLSAMGIRVPEDISLVGFDNYILSEMSAVKITTYGVDQDRMASSSVAQIRSRILHPHAKREVVTVAGEILVRESVKAIK